MSLYKLKKGDIIGIVSPSGSITKEIMIQFNEGVKFLKEQGFNIKYGKNIFKVDDYSAGTPEEKADDINEMFADKEVKAIICSQGGDNANSVLPLLDYELIKNNPKVFMGISDITVLLLGIYKKTGMITFHGNDIMWGFGWNPSKYDEDEFKKIIVEGQIGKIIKNGERKTVREGITEGSLVGGNIKCLMKLAGTDYFPEMKDSILFLEEHTTTPEECDYQFNQLKQMGVFEKIKGVVIGYIYGLQAENENLIQMEEVLLNVTKEYTFPILKINDFGHCCPNTTLPIGAKVRLDATNCDIEIMEHYFDM
ncbi:MAG TPA: hypothetical protein DEP72_03685 [Clostridiales bacterium]|nr:MAG: hypothetical protein A2Y18_00855 [Clostridiales bacterium GWD2_32_19]HCC07255.1 hypothetical protein [Clostridiales bacterium]